MKNMKKLSIGLVSSFFVISPLYIVSSCSNNVSSKINFDEQYQLFTSNLVNQNEVSKNLLSSILINNNLIKNIYDMPNIDPNVRAAFSFEKIEDVNESAKLYVQLYNYKNELIKFSTLSDKKEITIISGFKQLSPLQQENIKNEVKKFEDLTLSKSKIENNLPSSINDINSILDTPFIKNDNYNYEWSFDYKDKIGELNIVFLLNDKNNYPLSLSTKLISGFKTSEKFQIEIDEIYNKMPKDINLSNKEYSNFQKPFASSIMNRQELFVFYSTLAKLPELETTIVPPDFIINPEIESGFYVDISIDSYDQTEKINITINVYNSLTGELLIPTKSSDRSRYISNFKPTGIKVEDKFENGNELLKATMKAYSYFELHKLDSTETDYFKKLPNESTYDVDFLIQKIVTELGGDKTTGIFEITVDKFIKPVDPPKSIFEILPPEVVNTLTFKFRVSKINPSENKYDNVNGFIESNIKIEYQPEPVLGIEQPWFLIRPSSKLNIYDNGSPNFSSTKKINTLVISGFLTDKLLKANNLYIEINNKIKNLPNLTILKEVNKIDFESSNFDVIWNSLSDNIFDQLGFKFDEIPIPFNIKYEFAKNPLDDLSYKIHETTYQDEFGKTILIKNVFVTASVSSINDSDYIFDFVNVNSVPSNFEFNFAIKSIN